MYSSEMYDDYMSVVDVMEKKRSDELQKVDYHINEKRWNRRRQTTCIEFKISLYAHNFGEYSIKIGVDSCERGDLTCGFIVGVL